MPPSPILSLAPAVSPGLLPLGDAGPGLRAAVETLAAGGATEEDLAARVRERDGAVALLRFHQLLADLDANRLLCRGTALVTVVPFSRATPPAREGAPEGLLVLSRFAYLRREGGSLIAESPLAHSYLLFHGEGGLRLLAMLATPTDPARLEDEARLSLKLLWEAGFLSQEEEDPDLRQWEFHDLLFHARSRSGRHRNPYGGTFPYRGTTEPPPALKSGMAAEQVELFRPDVERLMREDPPFTRVIEERRSRRSPGEPPLTLDELGEFLYRSSRLRKVTATATHEISDRAYPGGGAVYELEIYPVVGRCEALDPGLYHYAPGDHRLERVSGMSPEARALIEAAGKMADAGTPDVLLVLAARFPRVTWKYRSMAYAGILKNVGALYPTMYLVATAMGLSAFALGGGDSDLFARAAGTRYTDETSVGEFILNR
ncbi:MAG TPA: SagB family peptide dehydrogenase [Thermoanaerobaculia bacterium]|nr:SagB family peptide dehydrogenase [Thermoanaerobaculia bacterium]